MVQPNDEDDFVDNNDNLDEDFDRPFSEPADSRGSVPIDHPSTDSGLDEHELYDEGLSGAAEADEPDDEEIM